MPSLSFKRSLAILLPTHKVTAGNDGDSAAKSKAQHRRAQVRRAQIQHRQRKANYVKTLELDVSQYRDMIYQAERQVEFLRKENGSMKTRLSGAGLPIPALRKDDAIFNKPAEADIPLSTEEMFADIDVDDLTVTLRVDEALGTPCFHISSSSSSEGSVRGPMSPPRSSIAAELSQPQEDLAINFILALEHVCWDHFWEGDFYHHEHVTESEKNHALMASTFCMSSAPESVFDSREMFKSKSDQRRNRQQTIQWDGFGFNLDALHDLAKSLNPSDEEIAPVQAWFELMKRYDTQTLLNERNLELLKIEFKGVVKCVAIGAAMERLAFQSVVTRVLGQPRIPWSSPV